MTTSNYRLQELPGNSAERILINGNFQALDGFLSLVADADVNVIDFPANPAEGRTILFGTASGGAAGLTGHIATFTGSAWVVVPPSATVGVVATTSNFVKLNGTLDFWVEYSVDTGGSGGGAGIPVVTSFPTSVTAGTIVIRSDLQYSTWTWVPNAGFAGEWWGPHWKAGFGGNTTNNTYFNSDVDTVGGSASAGIPVYDRRRILRVTGGWSTALTATVQLREEGVSNAKSFNISNTFAVVNPPFTTTEWLVGGISPTGRKVLAAFYSGASATITNSQFEMTGRLVRLQEE